MSSPLARAREQVVGHVVNTGALLRIGYVSTVALIETISITSTTAVSETHSTLASPVGEMVLVPVELKRVSNVEVRCP
jgi:hypothetical protein